MASNHDDLVELYEDVGANLRKYLSRFYVPYGPKIIEPESVTAVAEIIRDNFYIAEPKQRDSRRRMARRLFNAVKRDLDRGYYVRQDYRWAYCFIDHYFTDEEGF